jgi:hypothetical protein
MVEQSLQRAYKVEPASERSANTTERLKSCTCERYGRYGALLTPREVFWSRLRAQSWSWTENRIMKYRDSAGSE